MSAAGSITRLIHLLEAGNADALRELWGRWFPAMVKLAEGRRARYRRAPGMMEAEDVVAEVFAHVVDKVGRNRVPGLDGRWDLWRILLKSVNDKFIDEDRRARRLKRGGGAVRRESELATADATPGASPLDRVADRGPTPEEAAMLADQVEALFKQLGSREGLSEVARLRLEGESNEFIAQKLGYCDRTVRRKIELIRRIWEGEAQS